MAKPQRSRGKRQRSPAPENTNKKRNTQTTDIAARNAVFATTELLENILLHLPSKAIAKSQMISRKFRDVVEESPALQIKLFNQLDPETSHSQTPWAVRRSRVGIRSSGCISSAPSDHGLKLVLVHEEPLSGIGIIYRCFKEAELNWAIFDEKRWPFQSSPASDSRIHDLYCRQGEELAFTPESTYSLTRSLRGEAQSWERSYFSNPPCTRAIIVINIKFGPRKSPEPIELYIDALAEKTEGLTFGDLLEKVLGKKAPAVEYEYNIALTENGKVDSEPKFDGCVRDLICSLETKHKAKAWISAEQCSVTLYRFIVPTDEDRKNVVEIGANRSNGGAEGETRWWQGQMEETLHVNP